MAFIELTFEIIGAVHIYRGPRGFIFNFIGGLFTIDSSISSVGELSLSENHTVTEYEMSGESHIQKSGWINHSNDRIFQVMAYSNITSFPVQGLSNAYHISMLERLFFKILHLCSYNFPLFNIL